ncbi:MAG TPA: DUF502 domain-containing protein [Methyloceanibacter sp.]|nr:DUF502 domain-containing protein [Methyloceanibacter sp.]
MARIARIFLAGLLVLLPILVTVIVTAWVAQLLQTYAGPNSLIGRLIVLLGLNLASSDTGAYFLGFLIILGCIFLLGLFVETRLWPLVQTGLDSLISRIPLVSNVYELSKRFVAIVDRSGNKNNLQSMRPVWCFFGGEGGAAVLGLMPSPDPVQIGEHSYVGLLVPSAPVPFGGALIYVPTDWVKPADGGVERLMNVYVSMGVTPPESMPSITDARAKKAKSSTAKTPKSTG